MDRGMHTSEISIISTLNVLFLNGMTLTNILYELYIDIIYMMWEEMCLQH